MKIDPSTNLPKNAPAQPRSTKSIRRIGITLLNALTNLDSRRRIGLAVMFGMAIFLVLPDSMHLDSRILAAWISGVICFLGIVFLMMGTADSQRTCYRAQRQEAQHWTIFLLVVCTALISIFAIALMLADSKDTPTPVLTIQIALSAVAILCSWLLTHTMFALHYATCYYRESHLNPNQNFAGGIGLPDEEQPDYLDLMYFSLTIGMTSQTSDVSIHSRAMRRLALGHGVVSFFFYSVIIALSVGIVGGLI